MEEHVQLNKALGERGTDSGFPTTPAIPSSISSTAGPARPALVCSPSCCGSAWPPPSGMPGSTATARRTSTTLGCHATTGSPPRKNRPSSTSMSSSLWKATGG
jgi:hypothetical protein